MYVEGNPISKRRPRLSCLGKKDTSRGRFEMFSYEPQDRTEEAIGGTSRGSAVSHVILIMLLPKTRI